jgi:serine/threonine-protein kinase
MRGDLLRAASGRPVLATPVLRAEERVPASPPPPRVVGNRNTGAYPRVPQRRQSSPWLLVMLVILGVVALGALGTGLYLANRPQQSVVPAIQGLKKTDADTLLSQAKLTGAPSPVFDATCVKDTVTHQDTPAGRKITEGSAVSYEVCGGPQSTIVPQLAGLTQDQATTALQQAHLVAKFVPVDGLKDAKNKVQPGSINPKEGASVAYDSTVTVGISQGNQNVVPDLSGMTKDEATATLSQLGFTNVTFVDRACATPDQVGKVTGQTVTKGTTKYLTDGITVFIGKADQPSTSPTASPTSGG